MKNSVVTSAPSVEPITRSEAKTFLKVDASDTSEDSFIDSLIKAARVWCEDNTNRSLITQVRTQYMDEFYPCYQREYTYPSSIELMYGPVQSVDSVKYRDENDTLQTMSSSDYWVDLTSRIPRITVKTSWPTTKSRPNAVEIAYTAGYGDAGSDVPAAYKIFMQLFIAHFFENRVPEITGPSIQKFEFGIERLLDSMRVYQNAI